MKANRTILSVPGHNLKMHQKAISTAADVIMLDLEDSVSWEQKSDARIQVLDSINTLEWGEKSLTVRINSLDTAFAYRDLLTILENSIYKIDSIVVPKVNSAADIHFVSTLMDQIQIHFRQKHTVKIEASIESAQGLNNIDSIAKASPRMHSLVFGIADYTSSIGARMTSISGHGENEDDIYPGHRWHYPMSKIVMTAKCYNLLAIDAPYGNYNDDEGLKKTTLMASALGYDGRWAIHPNQIATINKIFTPTREEIERAAKIIEAARTAKKSGMGAVSLEGRMVDQASVRIAKKLWKRAIHLKLVPQDESLHK